MKELSFIPPICWRNSLSNLLESPVVTKCTHNFPPKSVYSPESHTYKCFASRFTSLNYTSVNNECKQIWYNTSK